MYTYICIYTHMVDIMSLVYSGYSEVIHGKLIHLKQFLEAARLRDAGFENVRRPECLGDLSQQKSHKPNQPSNHPLQAVQGTDLQHHQFLRYSDQAENLISREKDGKRPCHGSRLIKKDTQAQSCSHQCSGHPFVGTSRP